MSSRRPDMKMKIGETIPGEYFVGVWVHLCVVSVPTPRLIHELASLT